MSVLFDVAHSSYPPRLLAPEQLLPGNAKLAANHSVAALGFRPTLLLAGLAALLGLAWLLFSSLRILRTIPEPASTH